MRNLYHRANESYRKAMAQKRGYSLTLFVLTFITLMFLFAPMPPLTWGNGLVFIIFVFAVRALIKLSRYSLAVFIRKSQIVYLFSVAVILIGVASSDPFYRIHIFLAAGVVASLVPYLGYKLLYPFLFEDKIPVGLHAPLTKADFIDEFPDPIH